MIERGESWVIVDTAFTLEQQLLKDYYQERFEKGFEYSFVVPGMTRVVQAAGSLIRSPRDTLARISHRNE